MHDQKIKDVEEKFRRFVCDDDNENEEIGALMDIDETNVPVVWGRTGTGLRVEDLKKDHFEGVIEMLKV